jgi:alkyl hydroperoxide reductase subunit AhpF
MNQSQPEASLPSEERLAAIIGAFETVQTKQEFITLVEAMLQAANVLPAAAETTIERIKEVFIDPYKIDTYFSEGSVPPYLRRALKRLSSVSLN